MASKAAARRLLSETTAGKVKTEDGVVAETTDGYDNFLSRVGLNNDNLLSGGTYEFNLITRNRVLLEAAYRGSWIAGRVIDSVADDMTRAGVDITTKGTEDLQLFHRAMTRLQIWQSLRNTIAWGRLYGGAVAVMQISGQKLDTPLDPTTVAKGQFKGLAVYDRWMLNPVLSPVIEEGPEIGLPKFYQIVNSLQSYDPTADTATGQVTVHHSRCIRYTGIDLPWFQAITEMMWGESVLERMWDRLISFDNASMSAAQLIDRANLRTVGIDGLREVIGAGGDAYEGMLNHFEMMRQFAANESMTLLDKNDTFQSTAYSFAGLSDAMLQQAQQVSGAAEIPLVVLFGQSPAGLGTTADSDIRIYYDSINTKQEAKLRNPISTLIQVMWWSVYGTKPGDDLDFTFNPLWQQDATDKANNAKTNTETIIGAFESQLVPKGTAMRELKDTSGDTGLFGSIEDEAIAEAEAEPDMPPMPDMPAGGGENLSLPKPGADPTEKAAAKDSAWKRVANWIAGDSNFKESDHPRGGNGEFGSGG